MSVCTIEDCDRPHYAHGWCNMHWSRWKRHGDPLQKNTRGTCSINNCDKAHYAKTWCENHYRAWRIYGSPDYRGQAPDHSGTVTGGYRKVMVDGRRIREHRYIVEQILGRQLLSTEEVHHKNGDKLDNRPENLEVIDHVSHMRLHRDLRTACSRGHERTSENTGWDKKNGWRYCKACKREQRHTKNKT